MGGPNRFLMSFARCVRISTNRHVGERRKAQGVSGRADRGACSRRLDVYELALEFLGQANGIIE